MKEQHHFTIFYSHEHIDEMIRVQTIEKPISNLVNSWCNYISILTDNNYWRIDPNSHNNVFELRVPIELAANAIKDKFNPEDYPGKNTLEELMHSMLSAYLLQIKEIIQQQSGTDLSDINLDFPKTDINIMGNAFFRLVNDMNSKALKSIKNIESLPQKLGSLSGTQLDKTISDAFPGFGDSNTVSDLVEMTKNFQPGMDAFKAAGYNTIYEMLGYKKDSKDATYEAKQSDNGHLIFGLRSDVFITHDKKLYYRSIESKKHIKESTTQVIYAQNAIDELMKSYG